MRALTLVAQASLDGFVAGTKGEFDNFVGGEENLAFVCSITETADAALFGRVSYQLLESSWPTAASKPGATENEIKYSNWYNSVPKMVLSRTLSQNGRKDLTIIKDDVLAQVKKLKEQSGKEILIFGSPGTAQQLLDLDLIDHIWLIVHPVCFGEGIPLFQKRNRVTRFTVSASHQLSNGTLCTKYSLQH